MHNRCPFDSSSDPAVPRVRPRPARPPLQPLGLIMTMAVALTACSPPTKEDIEQREAADREQIEYCQDLLREIDRNDDRPLIRATVQETYNNDCLGVSYPGPGHGLIAVQSADLPCAPACLRNRDPVRAALARIASAGEKVLELGAGTGQHAVYCAEALGLDWQPTDLPERLADIRAWIAAERTSRVRDPLALDLLAPGWPNEPWPVTGPFDGVYSANTAHILPWEGVRRLFAGATTVLRPGGWVALYGPFNEDGCFTSEGNRSLDAWARATFPGGGLRDRVEVLGAASEAGLLFEAARPLPANNQLLLFRHQARTAPGDRSKREGTP